jgi:hypothetical protein
MWSFSSIEIILLSIFKEEGDLENQLVSLERKEISPIIEFWGSLD